MPRRRSICTFRDLTGAAAFLVLFAGLAAAQTAAGPAITNTSLSPGIAGRGATDAPVASGAGAPSNPLANTSPPQTLAIDSVALPVAFAGLTPGLAGLYQIGVQIPAGPGNGNHQLTVTQSSGAASNSTLLAVHN